MGTNVIGETKGLFSYVNTKADNCMFSYNSVVSVADEITATDGTDNDDFFDVVCNSENYSKSNTVVDTDTFYDITQTTDISLVKETQTTNEVLCENTVSTQPVCGVSENTGANACVSHKSICETDAVEIQDFAPVQEIINNDIIIVEEDINVTKYKGGVVTPREETEDVVYPCLYLKTTELPTYKANTLLAMFNRSVFDDDATIYACYLEYDGTVMQIGYIDNKAMRDFLLCGVFDAFEKTVYLDAEHTVKGKYIQALCTV